MTNRRLITRTGIVIALLGLGIQGHASGNNIGALEEGVLRPKMPLLDRPEAANKLISVDLNRVDIRIFIKTVSQLTGVNFFVDDKVKGNVTLMSPTQVRVADVYRILESVLDAHGYSAVVSGDMVKIVPRAVAAKGNHPIQVGADPSTIAVEDWLVTQIIPLQFVSVTQVNAVVSSLTSTGGQATVFPESNTVIITDTSSSIHRIARILKELDVEKPPEYIQHMPLKYASAEHLSTQITGIIQRSQIRPAGVNKRLTAEAGNGPLRILADDRTNSLIVMATEEDLQTVQTLVEYLDIESPLEAGYVHVIFLKHAEAIEMEKSVSAALGRISATVGREGRESFQITADESTNSLIVIAQPQDYKIVENMVKELDVIREQVLVEFKIVEVSTNVLKELGIDWATLDEAVADSVRGFAGTSFGPRLEASTGDIEGLSVGAYKQVGGETKIGAILKALERTSGVNVLSTPSILTSNHREAKIVVGQNVPYVRQSRVTEFDPSTPTAIRTFDFKDVGVELTVTPHVSAGGFVRLEIDTTFSKLIEGSTGLSNETPTTAQRKATTIISIMSDTTVVIGGLIQDDTETVVEKVPILGDLPLVGVLFRAERERVQKTNLLLFITPKVLADETSLTQMTEDKQQEHLSTSGNPPPVSPADQALPDQERTKHD